LPGLKAINIILQRGGYCIKLRSVSFVQDSRNIENVVSYHGYLKHTESLTIASSGKILLTEKSAE
jgi:hypothetical protein